MHIESIKSEGRKNCHTKSSSNSTSLQFWWCSVTSLWNAIQIFMRYHYSCAIVITFGTERKKQAWNGRRREGKNMTFNTHFIEIHRWLDSSHVSIQTPQKKNPTTSTTHNKNNGIVIKLNMKKREKKEELERLLNWVSSNNNGDGSSSRGTS